MNAELKIIESLLQVYKYMLWNSPRDRCKCYYPKKTCSMFMINIQKEFKKKIQTCYLEISTK